MARSLMRVPLSSFCSFPYTDTLKILQKWGPGCHFYGNGLDADIDDLEILLSKQNSSQATGASPPDPILALFCEFPSNPLLRCPDLPRLRRLADEYGFVLVVDETIGNFVNVEVLPYADMVVSSLTKVFSGETNVMGGSLVLNPRGPRVADLRRALELHYEDTYWGEDAIFMERNSRDFVGRVGLIDQNAEALCDLLDSEASAPRNGGPRIIKEVFFPKFVSANHYLTCRRQQPLRSDLSTRQGFGGLFSVTFTSPTASEAFYDALRCAKGPSLGTNFTLASPYTILAHYGELEWAEKYGVERGLVRVSVGLEETGEVVRMFEDALEAARKAVSALS